MARVRAFTLLLVVAAVVGLVAVGCGGTSATAPVRQLESLDSVASQSASADTARFELTMEMAFPGAPKPFALGAEGAFDSVGERAQMTVDLSSLASMLESFGDALGGNMAGGTGSPDDWKLDLIMDGDVVYAKVPPFASAQVPGGKSWIKGDLQTLSRAGGDAVDLGSLGGSDPRDVLEVLKAVSGTIETVGRESQRGVDTTHYRATLDLAALMRLGAGKQAAAALGDLDQLLEQSGLTSIPIDVWVDDDGLLRRMDLAFSMSQPGQGEASASITLELFDYDEPVSIELPPPADVADASTLQPGP